MKNVEQTKERIKIAKQIAEEVFGDGNSPMLVSAVLQSLSVDALNECVKTEFRSLADQLCQAAAVASGS